MIFYSYTSVSLIPSFGCLLCIIKKRVLTYVVVFTGIWIIQSMDQNETVTAQSGAAENEPLADSPNHYSLYPFTPLKCRSTITRDYTEAAFAIF